MKRTIIRGVSALLLVAASVAGAESTDGSPVEVLKENRLSYTDGFVDAVKVALDASPAQPQPPATGKPCDWSLTATPAPDNAQFLAFAGSQQLKYEVALIGYDVYDKARLNAKGAPADSEASRKLRFLQYMLGLSGYWDALAADHEKTLLSPAREGIVRHCREGTIVNARDNFAPATSAMGDLLRRLLQTWSVAPCRIRNLFLCKIRKWKRHCFLANRLNVTYWISQRLNTLIRWSSHVLLQTHRPQ